MSVEVRALRSDEFDAWRELVAASPDGSIYATAEYLDILCRAAGGGFRVLGAFRGAELVGGLPLYERRGRQGLLAGPRLLLYYHGPVLRRFPSSYPSVQTNRDLETLGALADHVAALGFDKVILKGRHSLRDGRPFLARGWHASPSYSYEVSLTDMAAAWSRVEQNLRRLVERCTAQGVVLCDDDDFPSFLRLHALTMSRHGAESYLPTPAFHRWFTALRAANLVRLFHARLPGGEAVASQVVLLGPHPVCHTVSAGADPAHRQSGVSAFLRWRVFERLAQLGYRGNDLTDAALNPVTHFKSQLGGDLVLNVVVETPGTVRWRAARAFDTAEHRSKALARRALTSLRPGFGR